MTPTGGYQRLRAFTGELGLDQSPPYWTRRFVLDRPQLPFEVVVEDPASIASLRQKLIEILNTHRERLRNEYEAALAAFELVEQLDEGASARASAV